MRIYSNAAIHIEHSTSLFRAYSGQLIKTWRDYLSLIAGAEVGFSLSSDEYINSKIQETVMHVVPDPNGISYMLDIGCGDCTLTSKTANAINMRAIAVDIDTDIDWTSVEAKSKKEKMKRVLYGGQNLLDVVDEAQNKYGINLKTNVNALLYNYSLHHFGSFSNILRSLKEAYKLMDVGAYLLIREHDITLAHNRSEAIKVIGYNLQHILLQLRQILKRCSIAKIETEDGYIYHFYSIYKKLRNEFTSHYFSFEFLKMKCEKIGFTWVATEQHQRSPLIDRTRIAASGVDPELDISNTVVCTFQRI
jgi:SAM-dependent methyltransferase